VEETATGPKRSKPFEIFEANVLRLTALATTPHSPISATVDRLRQQTEGATALAQELGKTINSGREGGYDSADFQKHAARARGCLPAGQTSWDTLNRVNGRKRNQPKPDLSDAEVRTILVNAMAEVGADSALVYAFRKTGVYVCEENEKRLSNDSLRAFDAALDEYYAALARPTQ
jgi:hypothetical protein